MSGYASYDNELLNKYPDTYKVPLIKATPQNFVYYGRFVYDYDKEKVIITPWPTSGERSLIKGTGCGGGVAEGKFVYWWKDNKLRAINEAVGGDYVTGILPIDVNSRNRTHVLTREANYHPDGGQVFYPIKSGTPFVLLLALPGDNVVPEDFMAFYFDGTCGAQIYPNIWHQPVYPIDDKATFMTKQGKVHACVGVETLKEFNKWLEIPLC